MQGALGLGLYAGRPSEQHVLAHAPLGQIAYFTSAAYTAPVGSGSGTGDPMRPIDCYTTNLGALRFGYFNTGRLGTTDPGGGGGGSVDPSSGTGDPKRPIDVYGVHFGPLQFGYYTTGAGSTNLPPVWSVSLSTFTFDEGVPLTIDLVASGYLSDPDGDNMVLGVWPALPSGFSIAQSPPRLIYDGTTVAGNYGDYFLYADDGHNLASVATADVGITASLTSSTLLTASVTAGLTMSGTLSTNQTLLTMTCAVGVDVRGTLTYGTTTVPNGQWSELSQTPGTWAPLSQTSTSWTNK